MALDKAVSKCDSTSRASVAEAACKCNSRRGQSRSKYYVKTPYYMLGRAEQACSDESWTINSWRISHITIYVLSIPKHGGPASSAYSPSNRTGFPIIAPWQIAPQTQPRKKARRKYDQMNQQRAQSDHAARDPQTPVRLKISATRSTKFTMLVDATKKQIPRKMCEESRGLSIHVMTYPHQSFQQKRRGGD